MVTGLTPQTFQNLQLNAGVFLKNFDWETYDNPDALETAILEVLESRTGVIGATIGDGSFQATPETRQIEANGMRYPIVGSTVNDMWTIMLTGTMKEITPQNFADALMCADIETKEGTNLSIITARTDIEASDYINSLCWIGDTSKGFVLIEIKNALNTTGANFTFTDKGEGSLPFEFHAHHAELKDMDHAPFKIVFFDAAE